MIMGGVSSDMETDKDGNREEDLTTPPSTAGFWRTQSLVNAILFAQIAESQLLQ